MKLLEKYFKLPSIVNKLGLKKFKTKNILAVCGKLKCQEKVIQNFSGGRWYPATTGSHAKLSWKRLQRA